MGRPKKTTKKRKYTRRKNIVGNFRGSEDIFMTKVRDGLRFLITIYGVNEFYNFFVVSLVVIWGILEYFG